MAHKDRTFFLPETLKPEVDWALASRFLRALPGNATVQMDPLPKTRNGILLPESHPQRKLVGARPVLASDDKGNEFPVYEEGGQMEIVGDVAGRFRPDSGIVLAANVGPEIEAGDWVLVTPYAGDRYHRERIGPYVATEDVAWLGVCTSFEAAQNGKVWRDPYDATMPAIIERQSLRDPLTIRPTGRNVLVRRDPLQEKIGNVHLPDGSRERGAYATVVAVGPGKFLRWTRYENVEVPVYDLKDGVLEIVGYRTERQGTGEKVFEPMSVRVGDRVKFHPDGVYDYDFGGAGFDENLAMLWEPNILGVIPCEVTNGD